MPLSEESTSHDASHSSLLSSGEKQQGSLHAVSLLLLLLRPEATVTAPWDFYITIAVRHQHFSGQGGQHRPTPHSA